MSNTFTGFSTVGSTQSESFKMYDLKLIEQDLMNHFHTRIGERVMRPEYGCRIWDYLHEPFTQYIKNAIVDEATRIVNSDSRVELLEVAVDSSDNSIQVNMLLNYIPFNITAAFILEFENRQAQQDF